VFASYVMNVKSSTSTKPITPMTSRQRVVSKTQAFSRWTSRAAALVAKRVYQPQP
ncbi:putative outer membrane receptor protein, partial [Vibrio parahaemolyticus IDH02189]